MSIPTQEIPVSSVFQGTRLHGSTVARNPNPRKDLTLAGATLVFYAAGRAEGGGVARTAWGFRKVAADSVDTPEIGRAVVGDDGSYHAALKEAAELVLVAIDVEKFSYAPATGKRAFGVLGVAAPRLDADGARAESLDIVLPPGAYCGILSALDLWLVAGNVTDCGNEKTPVDGVTVSVFDRDLTQDDALGSDVTDAGGNFDVFFPSAQFKKIPLLPPPFDSIAPFELFGGPDVYFRVTQGADVLLDEDPSQGRTAGRENVPRCSFHQLCASPPKVDVHTMTLWTHIGYIQVPDGGGLHGFDADGLTAAGKEAFFGSLEFRGQVSQQYLGEAVSYRFVYAEWADLATPPAYPADYQALTAANLDLSRPYGQIHHYVGPHWWNTVTTPVHAAPDAAGWIAVSQDPEFIQDSEPLVVVNTVSLVPPVGGPMEGTLDAGSAVPLAQQDRHRKFSFALEVKTASHLEPGFPVPIHLNNSAAYFHFDLAELAANACGTVADAGGVVTVKSLLTVAHPYLQQYRLRVECQGGGTPDPDTVESFAAHGVLWTPPAGETVAVQKSVTGGGHCSYRGWAWADRRLTNGVDGAGEQWALRTFCVE